LVQHGNSGSFFFATIQQYAELLRNRYGLPESAVPKHPSGTIDHAT
jgi:hypothetical protein